MMNGGRLLQEYVCMAYAKIENERLRYHSSHQKVLRKETYRNVERIRNDPDYNGELKERVDRSCCHSTHWETNALRAGV